MAESFETQVDSLIRKIKHYFITYFGRFQEELSDEEFYEALSLALREEIMIHWAATEHTYATHNVRRVYYLSMEYLPGRILFNNMHNLNAWDLLTQVTKKMNRSLSSILLIEKEPGLGNGGLGRLASCFLDSLASMDIPAMGYGLRYQYGVFEQEFLNGRQIETPDSWLLRPNPWEYRRDFEAYPIFFGGKTEPRSNSRGEPIYSLYDHDVIRALAFDTPIVGYCENAHYTVHTLRLWSTKESPRNFRLQKFNSGILGEAAENTALTDVLYPNDDNEMGKRMRLKQEFLLVSASLQDILKRHFSLGNTVENLSDKVRIQINDTHPALIIPELMRILIEEHHQSWPKAFDITSACMNYTNHTVMREALEEWNRDRLKDLLPRQLAIVERLNQQFCDHIRSKFHLDEEKVRRMSFIEDNQVKMAHMAIYGSNHTNGVAELHTEILKEIIFKDFHDLYPNKFLNVTNGVTQRRWLYHTNPLLSKFISDRIGSGWIRNFQEMGNLKNYLQDEPSLEALMQIKKSNKERLIHFIEAYSQHHHTHDRFLSGFLPLDSSFLFDMQIKRIHEYKRQLMLLLHTLILYQELLENPSSKRVKRVVILGGKAAPGYYMAKLFIFFALILARKINQDPRTHHRLRLIYIENYNVSKAGLLIPACDLSEQISRAGLEASGTGNMKLAINGALTIGTEDGANIEMRKSVGDENWPFRFGSSKEEIESLIQNKAYNPKDIAQQNPRICKALNALIDGSLIEKDDEREALEKIHFYLLEGLMPDPFFSLYDLEAYYQTQLKVEKLYRKPKIWAQHCLHNIASMGPFSSDVSIEKYARDIWHIHKQPLDFDILHQIRGVYESHDVCRVDLSKGSGKRFLEEEPS